MLEIARQMLYPDQHGTNRSRGMNHNDIFPRNILVTNPLDSNTPSQFYLIDFGLATRSDERDLDTTDLRCISDIMYSMMLGRLIDQARHRVISQQVCRNWPYSHALLARIGQVHEEGAKRRPMSTPPRRWFNSTIGEFRKQVHSHCEQDGGSAQIHMHVPGPDMQPVMFQGECHELAFNEALRGEGGCYPCQRAYIDVASLNVVEVETTISWSKPEDEPMLEMMDNR